MKRMRNFVLACVVLAFVAALAALSPVGPALAQATRVALVEVVNTADKPVPIAAQGSTRVDGVVGAQQSGPWRVGVAGTPTVHIASSDENPVIVRNAGDCAPFHIALSFEIPAELANGSTSFPVPADKRLVIEQVTIKGTAPPDGYLQTSIHNTVNGVKITPDLIMVSQGIFGDTKILLASQNVRWYADPGTQVEVLAGKSFPAGANIHATISGYFVECPPRR